MYFSVLAKSNRNAPVQRLWTFSVAQNEGTTKCFEGTPYTVDAITCLSFSFYLWGCFASLGVHGHICTCLTLLSHFSLFWIFWKLICPHLSFSFEELKLTWGISKWIALIGQPCALQVFIDTICIFFLYCIQTEMWNYYRNATNWNSEGKGWTLGQSAGMAAWVLRQYTTPPSEKLWLCSSFQAHDLVVVVFITVLHGNALHPSFPHRGSGFFQG